VYKVGIESLVIVLDMKET